MFPCLKSILYYAYHNKWLQLLKQMCPLIEIYTMLCIVRDSNYWNRYVGTEQSHTEPHPNMCVYTCMSDTHVRIHSAWHCMLAAVCWLRQPRRSPPGHMNRNMNIHTYTYIYIHMYTYLHNWWTEWLHHSVKVWSTKEKCNHFKISSQQAISWLLLLWSLDRLEAPYWQRSSRDAHSWICYDPKIFLLALLTWALGVGEQLKDG